MSVHVHSANIPCHLGGAEDQEMNTMSPPRILCRGLKEHTPAPGAPTDAQTLKKWGFARGIRAFQVVQALVRT